MFFFHCKKKNSKLLWYKRNTTLVHRKWIVCRLLVLPRLDISSVIGLSFNLILLILSFSAQGTHECLRGNARALSTVTAIIDGTGSIGMDQMSSFKCDCVSCVCFGIFFVLFFKNKHFFCCCFTCWLLHFVASNRKLTSCILPQFTVNWFVMHGRSSCVYFLSCDFCPLGAAVGPLLAGLISPTGWNNVFYMLITADVLACLVSVIKSKNSV